MSGRSLVEFAALIDEDGQLVISCFCDCGTATTLTLAGPPPKNDFAFTCDGCETAHWFAVTELTTD